MKIKRCIEALKRNLKAFRRTAFWTFFGFFMLILVYIFLIFIMTSDRLFHMHFLSGSVTMIIVTTVIALLIVSQGITIVISRRFYKPFEEISRTVRQVAKGNFGIRVDSSSFKGEVKTLGDDINLMIKELNGIEIMRSDFVASVSHEFRAPLSSIQGYVTLISNPSISDEQRVEYFVQLSESTRQLSGLVDSVLKLSRLESQNIVQKTVDFSLDEQIRRAVLTFENQWSEKELELELDLQPCVYHGNEEMTGQIWINLIGNAVKFNRQGGVLGISLTDSPDCVTVTVSDSGVGMTDEEKKHIFEKFYQADTSRKSEGNGLGLALVNTIARLLNYTVSVESELNKGSAFTVTLPKR